MISTLQRKQFHPYLQSKHANHEFITLRNLAKARKRDQILRSSSHGSHMMNADKDKNKIILPTIQTSFGRNCINMDGFFFRLRSGKAESAPRTNRVDVW